MSVDPAQFDPVQGISRFPLPGQQVRVTTRRTRTLIAPYHATRVCFENRARDLLFYVENPDFHEKDDQSD